MKNYKLIFKRNMLMMFLLVCALAVALFLVRILDEYNTDNTIKIGGSFSLTDQNGNQFKSDELKKKKLVYFGYTYCPDICPFDMLKLSNFIEKSPNIQKYLELIFITVDPERDSPVELKSYLENFDSSIIGLTGSKEEISNITKNFRVFVRKNKASQLDQNYLIDHSALLMKTIIISPISEQMISNRKLKIFFKRSYLVSIQKHFSFHWL